MTKRRKDSHRPPDDAVWFLPLGGTGEIGMNLSLYGTAGKWLMVDCGITFPDEHAPGIEVIMPDISFIAERSEDLVGLVITHGHEDHLGAIEYLWPQLRCPIYATPFAAEMIRAKTSRGDLKGRVRIIELPIGSTFETGPFKVEMVHVTHSIPEAHMLAITTAQGTVLHTGDWKLDPDPIIGDLTDEKRLKEIGRQGVMALIGDSTNAIVPGHSGSERDAAKGLREAFARYRHRIVVACFSSNTARLKSICAAAKATKREVGLVGRSLWRNAEIAEACGYLPEYSNFLSEDEAMQSPRENVVLVATGCQGEIRAALSRIAVFDHPEVELESGDVVIFSSRDIPGNEKSIGRVQNLLVRQGVEILTSHDAPVHVSGHPMQDEMKLLYQWIKPKLAVPVHGELRHQNAHALLAKECGVPATLIPANGQIIRLGPDSHEVVAEVPVGRWGLDGKVLRKLDPNILDHRRKMNFSGVAVVSVVLDRHGSPVHNPQVTLLGVEDERYVKALKEDVAIAVLDALAGMSKANLKDDNAVKNTISQASRRFLNETHGKKPVLDVHLVRV